MFHLAKEMSGRGQRRSREEKGKHGVGDFRFINIFQFFSIFFFFSVTLLYQFFFLYFFNPRPLLTPTPTTLDLLQVDLLASGASLFNPTKDFFESLPLLTTYDI